MSDDLLDDWERQQLQKMVGYPRWICLGFGMVSVESAEQEWRYLRTMVCAFAFMAACALGGVAMLIYAMLTLSAKH